MTGGFFWFFWIRSVKNESNLIKLFGQRRLLFEVAFWPEIVFWLEKAFFKWICLTSQSIERFGSPLMAESFQACYVKGCYLCFIHPIFLSFGIYVWGHFSCVIFFPFFSPSCLAKCKLRLLPKVTKNGMNKTLVYFYSFNLEKRGSLT